MSLSALTGTRLREHRLASGRRQADLAAAAGISASYLNLIEHNRRKVTPEVLDRLAGALGLDRVVLAGEGDAALIDGLRAAAGGVSGAVSGVDSGVVSGDNSGESGAELDRVEDFVSRFPGWAGLIVALDRRAQGLGRAVEALNDRMSHDPHLSQALHEVLSSLSSVRATAAILAETADLDPDWAARFHRNLHQDSERLAAGAEALVSYLDAGSALAEQGIAAPQEEVEDWLARRGWSISDAELAAGLPDEVAGLASSAARNLAQGYLARAARDAQALPEAVLAEAVLAEAVLAEAVAQSGPDALALAAQFDLDPLVVMRRLATVPMLSVGLVICDGSGTLTFRKPAAGFPLPRFGAACPLWPLYTALGRPMQPAEALLGIAGQAGRTFRVQAWCSLSHPNGPRGPELREAAMLILPGEPAQPGAVAVGSSCRVCPRTGCPARREPSILSDVA